MYIRIVAVIIVTSSVKFVWLNVTPENCICQVHNCRFVKNYKQPFKSNILFVVFTMGDKIAHLRQKCGLFGR